MAKLVLKTNFHKSKFYVEHKAIVLPLESNIVELLIRPKPNYSIDAKDFYNGYLPSNVNNITYSNMRKNVVAFIDVGNLPANKDTNISLPINCNAKLEEDRMKLTEFMDVSDSVIVNTNSKYTTSSLDDKTIYSVKNNLNERTLVLDKKFVVPKGGYFAQDPSYEIKGNINRYDVVSSYGTDTNDKTRYKLFKVYYTSPKTAKLPSEDTITFTAKVSVANTELKHLVATTKEEEQVYSYSITKDPGANGGTRLVKVKGVPQSTFKIILSNSNGETYNVKKGVYEVGGGILEGVIPYPEANKSYGLWQTKIKMPKISSAITYQEQFMDGKPIDHDAIISTESAKIASNPSIGGSGVKETKVAPNSSITISFDTSGGFDSVYTDDAGTANLIVGPGRYGEALSEIIPFKVLVRPSDVAKPISITRQPRYQQVEDSVGTYTNWTAGDKTDDVYLSDWNLYDADIEKLARFKIVTEVTGVGDANSDDEYGELMISGYVGVSSFGTGDLEARLDLLNFLTPRP